MKKIKNLCVVILCVLLMTGCTTNKPSNKDQDVPNLGVIQLTEHTSLNMIYDSFVEELKQQGYIDGETINIDFKNCQNEMSNIPSIVQNFESNKKDIVVTITTPVTQGAMALTKTTPVIFAAVTDPIEANVVQDLNVTDNNITGTSDAVNISEIIELALEIDPTIETIGFIYNPSETNSVSNLKKLEEICKEMNLKLETTSISTSVDLQTATSVLVTKVDAIFVPNDNTVAEAMPVLAKLAKDAKIPVFTGADSMVMDGGLATIGIDYVALGKKTAEMVIDVLNGKSISEMPVFVFEDDLYITVNETTLDALGIELPESILSNPKLNIVK